MHETNIPENTFSGDLEFGPPWKRPATPNGLLRMFQQVRNRELTKTLSDLQLGDSHRLLSVDREEPSRPLQALWDLEVHQTLSWTDKFGAVGPGLVLKRRGDDGQERYAGMVQIGGVTMSPKDYAEVPTNMYLRSWQSRTTKDWIILTLRGYFVSKWGLALLGKSGVDEMLWHPVPECDWEHLVRLLVENCEAA